MLVECVLHTSGNVDGIRRLIAPIDQVPCAAGSVAGYATRVLASPRVLHRIYARAGRGIHGLECSSPAILGEVIVEEAKTRANHGVAATSGRIREADAGAELLAVIVRYADWNLQRLRREICGILRLAAARGR